jgi:hypothetical protein
MHRSEHAYVAHRTAPELSFVKGKCIDADITQYLLTCPKLFSTLLKSDQWLGESQHVAHEVRGAINFRNVPGTQVYALGQPTLAAVDEVVTRIREAHPGASNILWITLREEPIVYVSFDTMISLLISRAGLLVVAAR